MIIKKRLPLLVVFFAAMVLIGSGVYAETPAGDAEPALTVPVPPAKSSKWPMFLPAVTKPVTYWSALTWAKCAAPYTLTFSVTMDGVTKKSVIDPYDVSGTHEGWVATGPGDKTVTWEATGGCGTWNGTLSYPMETGKNYTVNLYSDQVTGQPYIQIRAQSGVPAQVPAAK